MNILFFLVISTTLSFLSELRTCFFNSSKDKSAAEKIIKLTDNNYTQPVFKGYRGAAYTILSDNEINPFLKLKKFNQGKELLEQAIKEDSTIFDLRFLRFSVQQESPAFLGYKSNINNDKQFIINNVSTLNDLNYKNKVIEYLSQSKELLPSEKQKLKK